MILITNNQGLYYVEVKNTKLFLITILDWKWGKMFKLFFAPRMAKYYYKETKEKSEKKILEDLYDYYYSHANQVEKELLKAMREKKIPLLSGQEQSALIINEVNMDIVKYGNAKGYPQELIELFIQ